MSVLEAQPQDVSWLWQALALLMFSLAAVTIVHESAVMHRHPTEAADPTRVDINYASPAELDALPGIGPALAVAIVAARPYSCVDELERVKGISPKTAAKLRPLVKATYGRRTADTR